MLKMYIFIFMSLGILAVAQANDISHKPAVPFKNQVKAKTYSEPERILAKEWLICAEQSDLALVLSRYTANHSLVKTEVLSPRIIKRFTYLAKVYRLYAKVILGEREANRFYNAQYNEDLKLAKTLFAISEEILKAEAKKTTIAPEQLALFNRIRGQLVQKQKATKGCEAHFLYTAQPYSDSVPKQYSIVSVFNFIGATNPSEKAP